MSSSLPLNKFSLQLAESAVRMKNYRINTSPEVIVSQLGINIIERLVNEEKVQAALVSFVENGKGLIIVETTITMREI